MPDETGAVAVADPAAEGGEPADAAVSVAATAEAITTTAEEGDKKNQQQQQDAGETETAATADSAVEGDPATSTGAGAGAGTTPIVSSSKKTRPPYKYDPNKITLRFLFANRDGLTVTIECQAKDTVGEVKGALMSVWPEDLDDCAGGDRLRLVCMGKGYLMPDSRTLEDCQIPVFKTHPTPVNVMVIPEPKELEESTNNNKKDKKQKGGGGNGGGADASSAAQQQASNHGSTNSGADNAAGGGRSGNGNSQSNGPPSQTGQGCSCTIL